jgi:hypothetical protein|eukprot:TRINITY_DN20574_c0_g1_i1.p1 TRINITY_DN20574_c0_g1~~TRINITY_DN20574_c0_g1_i1.p1  ORF type:complete len:201 (+),score=23.07 TRINITY_DN20574_c0_g1_i1:106-708(+)
MSTVCNPISNKNSSVTRKKAVGCYDPEKYMHTDECTVTLMIKNIPCRCRADEIDAAIRDIGFEGLYDRLYLPVRRSHRQNFGYAFVSLKSDSLVPEFRKRLQEYVWKSRKSDKKISVQLAHSQRNYKKDCHVPSIIYLENLLMEDVADSLHKRDMFEHLSSRLVDARSLRCSRVCAAVDTLQTEFLVPDFDHKQIRVYSL